MEFQVLQTLHFLYPEGLRSYKTEVADSLRGGGAGGELVGWRVSWLVVAGNVLANAFCFA